MSNLGNGEKAEMLKTRADANLTLLPDFLFGGCRWDFNALCFWRVVALRRLKPRGQTRAPELTPRKHNTSCKMTCRRCRADSPPEEGLPETPFRCPTPEFSSSLNFATGTPPSVCLGHGPLSHGLRPQLGLLGGKGAGTLFWVMPSSWGGLPSALALVLAGCRGLGPVRDWMVGTRGVANRKILAEKVRQAQTLMV